jgi:hypothetical protein
MITFEKIEKYFAVKNKKIQNECIIDRNTGLINTTNDSTLIMHKNATKIPFKFGIVGNFECTETGLTTLENSPNEVMGNFGFYCYKNNLSNLVGGPSIVKNIYSCFNNSLTSLEGAPQSVGGYFYITWSENLPLLRLVRYKNIQAYNDQVNEIINKYCNHKPLKEAILLCQKELIDNGFVGNASW